MYEIALEGNPEKEEKKSEEEKELTNVAIENGFR